MIDKLNLLIINRFPFKEDEEDCWSCRPSPDGRYKTQTTYDLLVSLENVGQRIKTVEKEFDMIWKNFAPSKATMTTWRLLWDRLPTRVNLRHRRII